MELRQLGDGFERDQRGKFAEFFIKTQLESKADLSANCVNFLKAEAAPVGLTEFIENKLTLFKKINANISINSINQILIKN